MSRDYEKELDNRVKFLKKSLSDAHSAGFVFGNSGGKDSALVGILCKMACDNTVGVIMPCHSRRNYGQDTDDAMLLAMQFNIESRTVDLSPVRNAVLDSLDGICNISDTAKANIGPRLRMNTLYAIAGSENRLVVGTGNRSEIYMGYFTKWGDGASDINPIADLTASEVIEFLKYLEAPDTIIKKEPSAALFEGQTDEKEMGVSYAAIDRYILTGMAEDNDKVIIDRYHSTSEHKRKMPPTPVDK